MNFDLVFILLMTQKDLNSVIISAVLLKCGTLVQPANRNIRRKHYKYFRITPHNCHTGYIL